MVSIFEVLKDLLKEYKEVITIILSILLFCKGMITFFSSKPIERQLFSKEKKLLYEFFSILFIFIIAPTLLFTAFFTEKGVMSFFSKIFSFLITSLVFFCVIIFIKKYIISKIRNKRFLPIKILCFNPRFELILFMLIYINSLIVFGSLNASISFESINLINKLALFLLFMVIELYFVYAVIIWGLNLKITKPLLVSIIMEDGTTYHNYYIYNPSDKNFILIGKHKDPDLCTEPILIKVDKILSCKQVSPIDYFT